MATNDDLQRWIVDILRDAGSEMSVLEVSRAVWERHEAELRESGDLFFTWQYNLRWAAQKLRNQGVLKLQDGRRNGGWALAQLDRSN